MEFYSSLGNKKIKINFNSPIDISIPIIFSNKNVRAWGVEFPIKKPVKIGSWIGSVKKGASVNFNNIFFNPHSHVTHTECVGHITKSEKSINFQQKSFFFYAKLITVRPEKKGQDLIISKELISEKINIEDYFNTIIIRTYPNHVDKKIKDYTNQNPPYLTEECTLYLHKLGIKNLLIDLPSIDKEKDEGRLTNHKIFFDSMNGGNQNTITELVYVPNEVIDGDYFLNLQFAPIENDASPSRPLLFKIDYI